MNVQLEQSSCVSKPLVSISPKLRALDAFVRLVDCRLSALAYLGDEGDVQGNISVKDLGVRRAKDFFLFFFLKQFF